jgi:hypothetical protein
MAAERPFIYDPSQQVAKNIEGVNRSVQNAWQPLIENKIRDYESISNDLANIDEIKRNLKGYHADILTSRLGTLQGDLAKTIEKNGTINVAARAKVKSDIEQVKNLYIKSQQAGLVVEDVLSRIKENSAYINDVAGTRDAILREVRDPNAMLSGQSLSDKLDDIYSKGLNVPAIGYARAYNLYKHVQKVKKNWTNPETGDLETIEYTPVDGLVFNEKTGQLDADMTRIKELSKSFFTTGETYSLKQTIGAGQALNANVEDSVMGLYEQTHRGVAGFSRTIDKTANFLIKEQVGAEEALRKNSPQAIAQEQEKATLEIDSLKSLIKSRNTNTFINLANLGLAKNRDDRSERQFKYQKEQDGLTPGGKASSFSTSRSLDGSNLLRMSIKAGETDDEEFNGFGVSKDGKVFLTKEKKNNKGKMESVVATDNIDTINGVLNGLSKEKRVELLNFIKASGTPKNNPAPQAAKSGGKKFNYATGKMEDT